MVDDSYSWIVWGVPLIVVLFLLCCVGLFYLMRWFIGIPIYNGEAENMVGKTVLVTGSNTGIGKETAKDLARRGANVILLCRNMEKGHAAAQDIKEATGNAVRVQKLDLSSFESIRECAAVLKEQEPKIHVLINNAAVAICPEWKTTDGLEMQIGTNHFGHVLLTLLLLDNIKAAAPSRIVIVASLAHKFGDGKLRWDDLHMKNNYNATEAYGKSKLANILFSDALSRKLEGTGVTTYSLHPGAVKTEWNRHMNSVYGYAGTVGVSMINSLANDPVHGAQTTIACAVDTKIGKETGKYYSSGNKVKASKYARNEKHAERLWEISLETVNLKNFVI